MQLRVNGRIHSMHAGWYDESLLMVLREAIGLAGPKFGCGLGQCGACTVLVDGQVRRSCVMPVAAAAARRFRIGAPDAVAAILMPAVLARVAREAPRVDLALRQVLPAPQDDAVDRAWHTAWSELESRALDVAILPLADAPLRFERHALFTEDLVIVARRGHPFVRAPDLDAYCDARHVVVSQAGDARGFVERLLAARRRSRRIAATVPGFMFALATASTTDWLCAVPRRFAVLYAQRFGVSAPTLSVGIVARRPLASRGLHLDGIARAPSSITAALLMSIECPAARRAGRGP